MVIKTYSGYKGVIGILTSTHQSVQQVLRCMESCKGYPIWVHDNSNDSNHIQIMEKAVRNRCHYFSSSISNNTPGKGKNTLMKQFAMDTNLRFFDYCYLIDSDDEWGDTLPELFKKHYTGDILLLSGQKNLWHGKSLKTHAEMVNEVINHVGEEYTVPDVSMKTIMEMNEMLSKFYKHPNGEQGTVNRLIGFNKTAHHRLQFHEDIRMGEDLLFMVDAVMAEKRGELKLNYLHDENLHVYNMNEQGVYIYNMSRPKEKWLSLFRSHLPKSLPRNIHKYKVEWI